MFELYQIVEKPAPEIIVGKRQMYKGISTNVDFYSGMVYNTLGLPYELFTPYLLLQELQVGVRNVWKKYKMLGKLFVTHT